MIREMLQWMEEIDGPLLVSKEMYDAFMGEEVVLLVSFSDEETLFYKKLQVAIQERLFPAKIIQHAELSHSLFRPKLILATRTVAVAAPFILTSPPSAYQNQEAKATLWKNLCQILSPPQSS